MKSVDCLPKISLAVIDISLTSFVQYLKRRFVKESYWFFFIPLFPIMSEFDRMEFNETEQKVIGFVNTEFAPDLVRYVDSELNEITTWQTIKDVGSFETERKRFEEGLNGRWDDLKTEITKIYTG